MMRLLLTLISFFCLNLNCSEYYQYTVKPGDTLSQIAADALVDLEEIYVSNKGLGFNPNRIEIGEKIFIPFKEDNKLHCPSLLGIWRASVITESSKGFYLDDSQFYYSDKDHLISQCFDTSKSRTFENLTDRESIELILSDKSYEYSFYRNFWDIDNGSAEKIVCSALLEGAESYFDWSPRCNYQKNDIINSSLKKELKNTLLFFNNFLNIDDALAIKSRLLPLEIRAEFQADLLTDLFNTRHKDVSSYFDQTYETLKQQISKNKKFTTYTQLTNLANFFYVAINIGKYEQAFELDKSFKEVFCNSCDMQELRYQIAKGYGDKLFGNSGIYEIDRVLSIYFANSINIESNFISYDQYQKKRIDEIEYILAMNQFLNQQDSYSEDTYSLSILYSDLSTDAALNGKCDYAEKMLELSWQARIPDDMSDGFREPIQLANCYLRQNNLEKAKSTMELALSTKQMFLTSDFIYEAMAILARGFIANEDEEYLLAAQEKLISENIYTSASIDDFQIAVELMFLIEKTKNSKKLDYIKIKNKLNSFVASEKLIKAKITSSNDSIKKLQNELTEVSNKINRIEANLLSISSLEKSEVISLYENRKKIIEAIFEQSEKIDSLYSEVFKNQYELMERVPNNSNVLTYFIFNKSAWAVIFSKNSIELIDLETNYSNVKNQTDLLASSLKLSEKFNFEASNNIYNLVFKKIDNFFTKNSTILIYDSNELSLPLSILSRNLPDSTNYELALINANWLIKDYAFAYIYPVKNQANTESYQENFLGLANSSPYDWADLPTLKSSIKEVQNLAMSSNAKKENILVGNNATKENLLKKLEKNYKRIVIATHAVPEGWKGYTNEAALLLSSARKDFFLTSSEIAQQDFDAEMIILSSCSGISNDFKDLYKSFLVGGARSVLHANWQLESKFATEFTDEFFKELWINENINKHEAMRNVSLAFLNDYSNPMYADPAFWGNFSIGYNTL